MLVTSERARSGKEALSEAHLRTQEVGQTKVNAGVPGLKVFALNRGLSTTELEYLSQIAERSSSSSLKRGIPYIFRPDCQEPRSPAR